MVSVNVEIISGNMLCAVFGKFLIQLYRIADKGYINWVKETQTMTP
jgi:hypothetical protein